MNDKITLYYYTAWDGFAWQGCDDATASALQQHIKTANTLPKSSVEHPPYGGAFSCLLAGVAGVAVYRYHLRLKGDLSGRDSLYIALAFVPLDVGCVDFAKLLELPQLAGPKSGELHPETISADELDLRLHEADAELREWLDGDIADTKYHVLRGRDGLRALSRLLFSRRAQLGFLNAVFRCRTGLDDLMSIQRYDICPEVLKVVAASKALEKARQSTSKEALDEAAEMKSALDGLEKLASRCSAYPGVMEYHDEKAQKFAAELALTAGNARKTVECGLNEKQTQSDDVRILQMSNDLAKQLQMNAAMLLEKSNDIERQLRQMRVSSRASGIACGPNDVRYASVLKALRIVGVVALVLFVVNVLLVLKIVFFSSSVAEGGAGNSRSEFKVDLEGSSR